MNSSKTVICSKCGKEYKVEIVRHPCKLEETRIWESFYDCPYCGNTVEIHLNSDEDVKSKKDN